MKKLLLVALLLLSATTFVQDIVDNTSRTSWQMLTYDVGNMFKGVGYAYSRPLHWKGKQWGTFGRIAAGTGVLYIFDEGTSEFAQDRREKIPEFIREYGEFIGNPENNYMVT